MDDGDESSEKLPPERKLLSALNNLPPAPDLSKHLNVRNGKILATLLVFGFVIYHSVLLTTLGSDSCKWLLSDGRFQGSMWQPYGCMMHTYTPRDARSCIHYVSYWKGRNHIVFMGDAHMRDLFNEFVAIIHVDENVEEEVDSSHVLDRRALIYSNETQKIHSPTLNEHYEQTDIGLYAEFIHFPFLNKDYINQIDMWGSPDAKKPTLIITSLPLCEFKSSLKVSDEDKAKWKTDLDVAATKLERLKSPDSDVVWYLQDPKFDVKTPNVSKAENVIIDAHNRAVIDRLDSSNIKLWKSSRLIAQIFQKKKNITYTNETEHSELDTQILLNYKCNGNMYYQDGTCCTTTEQPTLLQFLSAIAFIVCITASIVMFIMCRRDVRLSKTTSSDGEKSDDSPSVRKLAPSCSVTAYETLKGFSKLGIIVAYAYLCDRTTFFMKENKSYTHLNFLFPLGYVLLLGLFLAKDSKSSQIMHRDQTDEWKGWMQLVILIYHFTGASQVLPIYMFIRCLVTSYIFLSAYGNFMYSYNTGDYSVHRFFTVLVRFNLLVICLCMVMNRPYQFYYFVPLITFWYTVMFITGALWPRLNKDTVNTSFRRVWYLIIKLAILATLTTLLFNFEYIFEKIFMVHPIKPLFVMKDNTIHEWWFRWSLDRYSSVYGVLFALLIVLSRKYHWINDKDNESCLFRSDGAVIVTAFLSVAGILGYVIMVIMCGTKENCNKLHSYVSFIPILCYILLRNLLGPIRTLYSPFFAWFGKFALELFVAQYHIWLAADTHGILVLVPNLPILNVIVTTFIFIFAAHELHSATARVTMFLVPNDWRGLLRNLFIFLCLTMLVAFYSGSFNV